MTKEHALFRKCGMLCNSVSGVRPLCHMLRRLIAKCELLLPYIVGDNEKRQKVIWLATDSVIYPCG